MANRSAIDKTFWGLFIILIVVAIIALFSASSTLVYKSTSMFSIVGQQILFIALGVLVAYGVQFMPSVWIRRGGYALLAFAILMCLCTMMPSLPFVKTINGASRWVQIWKISFQPSELAKLSMVVVIADLLSRAKDEEQKRKYFYWSAAIAVMTTFPILLNNLSTAVLIWTIFVAMLFLARIQWKYILMCVFIPLFILVTGLGAAKLYISSGHELTGPFERAKTWVTRLDEFGNKAHESKEQQAKMAKMTPEQQRNYEKAQIRQDMQNKNSQRTFSLLAVWRGGKSPLGVLPGNSKERDFLPVAYADYIFAIIVEESGVIGAAFLMFLFLAILFRACYVSSRFDDFASMLMMMGLALMLTCQALISMMVVVGLGPVTGQPLPLITRGGTSAIVTSLYFGIMMCVSREQTMLRKRVSGTEEESKNDIPELLIMEPETKEPEPAPELVIQPVITEEEA